MGISKSKDHKFYVINIKLRKQGKKFASEEDYKNLLLEVYKRKVHMASSPGKHCIFKIMVSHEGYISGKLVQFTFIDGKKWVDLDRLEDDGVEVDLPKNHYPDPVETEFIFVPEAHRLAFKTTSSINISPKPVRLFLESALNNVKNELDFIQTNIEVTRESIEKIFQAHQVDKVSLNLNYSNFDFGDEIENFIDEDLRNTSTEDLKMEFKSVRKDGLNLANSKLLKGFMKLTKSNGSISATVKDINGKRQIIKSENHPEIIDVHADVTTLNKRVYEKIISTYRPEDSEF